MFRLRCSLALIFTFVLPAFVFAESPQQAATIGRKLEGIPKASTFIKLLKNTDKAEALLYAPQGQTTVFVPTNKAFENMSETNRMKLMDPSNKHWLERVLTYHAVPRKRIDNYIVQRVEFLRNGIGQYLSITRDKGATRVDGAKISEADLFCSNGIVHFIDEVLEPVELDLFEELVKDGRFKILTKLITRSGLSKLFQNRHEVYTVFAPTDKAFQSLPAGTIEALMSPEKIDLLNDVIRSHIVKGVRTIGKLEGVQPLGTPGRDDKNQLGEFLIYRSDYNTPTIDNRRILESDLVTRNGFIHVIDRPLLPKRESLADRLQREGRFDIFLSLCKQAGVYDKLEFNSTVTVFAPVDEVFQRQPLKSQLAELRKPENGETLRGLLLRHFVNKIILTSNAISYQRFSSALQARVDLERDGDKRAIQGVDIIITDLVTRNGVANGINGLIAGDMEETDQDQNWFSYRDYVQETLKEGSRLYTLGKKREATDYYARRNYEFRARYRAELSRLYRINADRVLSDDRGRNFRYDFASRAWRQRSGFVTLLREIESTEPLLIDQLKIRDMMPMPLKHSHQIQ